MKSSDRRRSNSRDYEPEIKTLIDEIKRLGNPKAVEGMSRFGIQTSHAFGVSIPNLRALARKTGRDHALAVKLWKTGIHEARILAGMIDDSNQVTEEQMDNWAKDFDSWDVVDQCCGNLFCRTPFAISKAQQWSSRSEEFVKRAGFTLIATLAVHDKEATNDSFEAFLPIIIRESGDDRNFVKKAVNWSLRQIGKRNLALNKVAIETAMRIQKFDSRSARWIATDALRELTNESVQKRLKASASRSKE